MIDSPAPDKVKIKVALVPFENVDTSYYLFCKKEIEAFYGCEVLIRKKEKLPAFAFYKPRGRYKADSLILYLKEHLPEGCRYTLGLTEKDVSTQDEIHDDWGVFGLGYIGGPSCVVSDFRLKKNAKNKAHLKDRLIKVVLHELGHTFGLQHCISDDKKCLMKDAGGTIKSVDSEEKHLCESCKEKVRMD